MPRKKDHKFNLILLLGCAAIILLALLFLNTEKQTFQIQDKCGRFINLFSHTIEDEQDCRTQCTNRCATKDMKYSGVEFTASENGCNDCQCTCSQGRWW